MARTVRLVLLAALGGLAPVSAVSGQEYGREAAPMPMVNAPAAQQDVLPGLPQVASPPQSPLAPPPPHPPAPPDFERPYFQNDPLLDPASLPFPGWFTDAEVVIVDAHVRNSLVDFVQVGSHPANLVGPLGAVPLDWTASPKVEVGYRLPSGFGAFSVGYRGLATQ